jgi:hypothetical protein
MHDIHQPDEQGYIPGVGNYCDRRCERCRFVRQCRMGAFEMDEPMPGGEVAGEKQEDLRDRFIRVFGLDPLMQDAGSLLNAEVEEEDWTPDPEDERRRMELDRTVARHPIVDLTRAYIKLVDAWMKPLEGELKAQGIILHKGMELAVPAVMRTPEAMFLSEAFQEMLWFQHMIHVKCTRAIKGRLGDNSWMEAMDMDPLQSDWNGTAKLAIEITRRSCDAWEMIAALMPDKVDGIKPLQLQLHKILRSLKKEFPDAQKFIRAGFDRPE